MIEDASESPQQFRSSLGEAGYRCIYAISRYGERWALGAGLSKVFEQRSDAISLKLTLNDKIVDLCKPARGVMFGSHKTHPRQLVFSG